MQPIKSYFIDTKQNINIFELNHGDLNRHFGLSSNTIISFINHYNHMESITFIFERRLSKETLLLYNKLFLQTIDCNFSPLIKNVGVYLTHNEQVISENYVCHDNRFGLFSHSILLKKNRPLFEKMIPPREFSISVLNSYKETIEGLRLQWH